MAPSELVLQAELETDHASSPRDSHRILKLRPAPKIRPIVIHTPTLSNAAPMTTPTIRPRATGIPLFMLISGYDRGAPGGAGKGPGGPPSPLALA